MRSFEVPSSNLRCTRFRCPSFKADKVCKHSVAVAEKNETLRKHLEQICKGQGKKKASRTALAEAFVNKSVAGKKGSRNKFHYRPSNANDSAANAMQSEESSNNAEYVYNEIYHHPFVLCMLPSDAKTCKGCKNDFCHMQKIIPFDLVFSHKERYYYMEIGKTNKLQTRSQRVTTMLTQSVSCHGSLTSLTTISRSLARFATHSKNRTKFIWRIYSRYQSSGKFVCSFVS